jgi:hypothetical protein
MYEKLSKDIKKLETDIKTKDERHAQEIEKLKADLGNNMKQMEKKIKVE